MKKKRLAIILVILLIVAMGVYVVWLRHTKREITPKDINYKEDYIESSIDALNKKIEKEPADDDQGPYYAIIKMNGSQYF